MCLIASQPGSRIAQVYAFLMAAEHVFEDPVGNQLVVEALTCGTAVVRLIQQEGEQPCVIITPDEAQKVADAVRAACGS